MDEKKMGKRRRVVECRRVEHEVVRGGTKPEMVKRKKRVQHETAGEN
jgi:hypothetical protein